MAVRPIDANELYRIEKLLDTDIVRQDKVALNLLEQVLYDIQHVPTLDPESLRPRGTWEGTADGYANGELVYDTWTCSECGYTVDTDDPDDLTKFCPNCGAKMEGGHNP